MTYREWKQTYQGTDWTLMLVAMMASIVISNEYVHDPFWLHLVVGLVILFGVQFGLSAVVWQITERRRRRTEAPERR